MIKVESTRRGRKIIPQKVTMSRKEFTELKEAYWKRTACTRTIYYELAKANHITKTEAFQVLMAVVHFESKYPVKLEIKEEE